MVEGSAEVIEVAAREEDEEERAKGSVGGGVGGREVEDEEG